MNEEIEAVKDLAELYRTQGHYSQAELLHKRSLAIREKAFDPDHHYVAMSLTTSHCCT